MPLSEEEMRAVEERFPELGRLAVADAADRAKKSGQVLVISSGGELIEVSPDGTFKSLKKLPPRVKVTQGQRLKFR